MKHKHYDLIVKWASDPHRYIVESYLPRSDEWAAVPSPMWTAGVKYRLIEKTPVAYRVFECNDGSFGTVCDLNTSREAAVDAIESNASSADCFKRWVTDWTIPRDGSEDSISVNGVVYEASTSSGCNGCAFECGDSLCKAIAVPCAKERRKDGRDIIWVKK